MNRYSIATVCVMAMACGNVAFTKCDPLYKDSDLGGLWKQVAFWESNARRHVAAGRLGREWLDVFSVENIEASGIKQDYRRAREEDFHSYAGLDLNVFRDRPGVSLEEYYLVLRFAELIVNEVRGTRRTLSLTESNRTLEAHRIEHDQPHQRLISKLRLLEESFPEKTIRTLLLRVGITGSFWVPEGPARAREIINEIDPADVMPNTGLARGYNLGGGNFRADSIVGPAFSYVFPEAHPSGGSLIYDHFTPASPLPCGGMMQQMMHPFTNPRNGYLRARERIEQRERGFHY